MSLLDVAKDAIKNGRLFGEPEPHSPPSREIRDIPGPRTVTWNPEDHASVAEARREFQKLLREGYQAFRMNVLHEDGVVVEEDGERVTEVDPALGKVLMTPHMRGG